MEKYQCDLVIPVFNKPELTKRCIDSIYANITAAFNLILIDNCSAQETEDLLKAFKASHNNIILLRNDANLGWVKAINQGIGISVSPYVCIMNNDTVVKTKGWLSELMDVAQSESDIGLVNPRFELKKKISLGSPFIEIDFCRGYCVLIKRSVIDKIGMLDEAYGFGYYDDDDYSVRAIMAGFRCVRANNVLVEHLRDSTFSSLFGKAKRHELHENNKKLFYSKWGRRLKLVFIFTKKPDLKNIPGLLLRLLRRQHIAYLWSGGDKIGIRHINIREVFLPFFSVKPVSYFKLFCNNLKKKGKRYDVVFTDDKKSSELISCMGIKAYFIGGDDVYDRVEEIIFSEAKV